MLRAQLRKPETDGFWPCPEGMHPVLHRLLSARGVNSCEEAERFMHPSRDQLHDPFLMQDMDRAVAVIRDALEKKESICVYGDYDVDGVCASAILTLYLKEQGADCDVYLPSRHTEGYGLNADAVDALSRRFRLLVTVDCGITAFDLVERAKSRGMRVIVTDHHKPDDRLPDCPTINPLLGGYPFGFLCGTGVAFQLVTALAGRDKAMEYIDLAALATIADIVPLRDENRVIATLGLKKINLSPRPGVRALIGVSGLEGKEISAGNVAFQMTPRMNASGRLGDAKRAYDLMVGTDRDACEALALELDEENRNRKEYENKAIDEAEAQLQDADLCESRVLMVQGDDWNPGVIGLTASRLTEKYHCPTVALCRDGDSYIGSCRSIEGVDIHEALTHAASLLERFGGHKMAAGLKVKAENLEAFKKTLNDYLVSAYTGEEWIPVTEYDAQVEGEALTEELVRQVEALAPTGCGNPAPVFRTSGTLTEAYAVGREKEHLKLTLKCTDGIRLPGIWFRHAADAVHAGEEADLLYAPALNEYMGRVGVQADVKLILTSAPAVTEKDDASRFAAFLPTLCREFGAGEDLTPVTLGELKKAFAQEAKGRLVLAADAASARMVWQALNDRADLCVGGFPEDRRGFNAVCVSPEGEIPACYRRIYYAGIPEALCARGARVSGIAPSSLFAACPDKPALREICREIRNLDGTEMASFAALAAAVARARQLSLPSAALGLSVLFHMGTARLEDGVVRYDPTPRNPETDNLYTYFVYQRGHMA